MIITIESNGDISFLGDLPFDLPMANPIKQRVSKIEPQKFWKKKAFQVCRFVAGDTGRAAAFTRTWSGPWRATILATGETKTFNTRAEAVAWEIQILESL